MPVCSYVPVTLIVMPELVDAPGKYKLRSGEIVTVLAASRRNFFECFGYYMNGVIEHWHRSGRVLPFTESQNDIVQKI